MIYLGEQLDALNKFKPLVTCWFNIKRLGNARKGDVNGYQCVDKNCRICNSKIEKLNNTVIDYTDYLNFICPYLNRIIECKPNEIISLQDEIKDEWLKIGLGTEDHLKEKSKHVFTVKGYKEWFTNGSINYSLAEWLDKHTCVYCNRQYIFTTRKIGEKRGVTCQFDHWFDKGSRPLFALSFYNLIPSCSVCNSSVKSRTHFNTDDYLHPYIDKDISSRFKFSSIPNTATQYGITFLNENKMDAKTKKTLEGLGTKLVYSKHSEKELQDLIDLRMKYSDNYLKNLLENTFKNELYMTKEEKYRLIFGIELSEDNMHKRPFSKFKKDIIDELLRIK
ncbi:hypothetical protein [Psychroserpens luteus]|uniref:TIGR02646 family protein n=1 Tax=Psychroserpens luteus TaxID=1434066 RepID=A0ABW5ZSX7_9FLAO|nr:hypothetical protein [Psychroserpens luteus]